MMKKVYVCIGNDISGIDTGWVCVAISPEEVLEICRNNDIIPRNIIYIKQIHKDMLKGIYEFDDVVKIPMKGEYNGKIRFN